MINRKIFCKSGTRAAEAEMGTCAIPRDVGLTGALVHISRTKIACGLPLNRGIAAKAAPETAGLQINIRTGRHSGDISALSLLVTVEHGSKCLV